MQEINEVLKIVSHYITGDWFVFFLLGTGLFFTIYLKFPQIRYFRHALRIVKGTYDKEGDEGDTSHFQALSTALSGTVGTGNIAGVALAIHIGGPAAMFWMITTAFLGMTTKFVEVTLSHKYREKTDDGLMSGGPMYYMKKRLHMRWLAVIFALATIVSSFGTGNMPQINSISNSIFATFGVDQIITGAVLSVLLGFVIIGGIRRIAKVTEKLVPGMAIIYLIGALSVILYNYDNIIPSFISIFQDVFTGTAAMGGFLGAGFSFAFNKGVNRGLFSNEAGQGSAPIAHSSARAHEPVSEGMVAILEPFIDTILICTLTGLVLLSSGVWKDKFENQFQRADMQVLVHKYDDHEEGVRAMLREHLRGTSPLPVYDGKMHVKDGKIQDDITLLHAQSVAENVKVFEDGKPYTGTVTVNEGKVDDNFGAIVFKGKSLVHSAPLTAEAFKRSFFGDYGQYIVSLGLLLFAFSTAISWSYYGGRSTTFLFGTKYVIYYRILYVVGFFLASFVDTSIIWTFSEIAIACMTIPNLFGILMLRKEMRTTIKDYWGSFKDDHPDAKIPERVSR